MLKKERGSLYGGKGKGGVEKPLTSSNPPLLMKKEEASGTGLGEKREGGKG